MVQREVLIDSYFSLPTDLAAEMASWPEFVSGTEYNATLRSEGELVETSIGDDEGRPFVSVRGSGSGDLFYKVLGLTLYALAGNSDDVWPRVTQWNSKPGDDT